MPEIATVYVRWMALRALLHRGYWLVTSMYLVLDADLTAFQLVFLGTAQGIIALLVEVPAGVVADTISRRTALVISHILIGSSMMATGLVTAFPALVATQMLWGVGWTFASGADVAWVTDELDQPGRIARVLTAAARWELGGSAAGMVSLGLLALLVGRGTAMMMAGAAMIVLGLYVAVRFSEHHFNPAKAKRWSRSVSILRDGIALARRDREILLVLAATVLVNGAAEIYGRLYPKQLVRLGFPEHYDPIVWYTALSILAFAAGALSLRVVEERIDGAGSARRVYAATCVIGALGLVLLATATSYQVAGIGVLLVGGVAVTVTRAVGSIWVNRHTSSDVRATMHSILAQAEYSGEIAVGLTLAAVAQFTGITVAFAGAAAILALTSVMVARSHAER